MLKEQMLQQQKKGARQVNTEERLVLKRLREIFETKVHGGIPSVKNVEWEKTKREVELLNNVIANVKTKSESEDNKLLAGAAFLVAEMVGVETRQKSEKSRYKPYWKRGIENNANTWRKHLSKLEEVRKGNHVLFEKGKKEIIRKYDSKANGYINVISKLKVKVYNGSLKLKNYEIEREQFQ